MANNTVNPTNSPNIILITDSDQNQVVVTQPVTNLIEVGAIGPQGAKGDSAPFIRIGNTNTWYTISDIEITGSLTVSGSNTFRNVGTGLFTGSVIITGSALYNSYELLNTDMTGSLLTTSSFNSFTASYLQDSASFDTRILINSSSITILSGSFLSLSGSYLIASASFDSRINLLSASFQGFSSSYVSDSGSFNQRITNLENFSSSLDNTFVTQTELNSATASLSESISALSSSFVDFSGSYNTGSFTGSFTGFLEGTSSLSISSSYSNNTLSASYANTASYALNVEQINTGSLVTTSSFNAFTSSYNTGSFTGSFTGDGSQLTGIVSSKWSGSNPITRDSDVEITGSLRVTQGISGSFSGSGADLFNIPASGIVGLNLSQIASGSATASISPNTGFQINTDTSITGDLTASNALIPGNVVVQGTASINTLVVNQTQYTSGSNQLGDGPEDVQTLFGTVRITTGPFAVTGSSFMTGSLTVTSGITGSLFGTSSLALTASYIDGGFY